MPASTPPSRCALSTRLAAGDIDAVTLGLPRAGMRLIGEPAAHKANPRSVVDGQFSGPFVIASALATGRMAWDSYEKLADPTIRGLLPKVRCEFDPEIEAEFPANMAGKLTIRARGTSFIRKVSVPKGEPGNFLTETELRGKFAGLVEGLLGRERTDRLAGAVGAIDTARDIGALARLSVPLSAIRAAGK